MPSGAKSAGRKFAHCRMFISFTSSYRVGGNHNIINFVLSRGLVPTALQIQGSLESLSQQPNWLRAILLADRTHHC